MTMTSHPVFIALMAVLVIVVIRNLIAVAHLLISIWVFYTRPRPTVSRQAIWARRAAHSPPITIIAPAFNESLSVVDSAGSLLAIEYPDHQVIIVNDGSSDDTLERLIAAFQLYEVERRPVAHLHRTEVRGVYASRKHRNLTVIDKMNGRKADAVNAGLSYALTPLVCIIDADTIVEPDGLLRAAKPFVTDDGSLLAVGGTIRAVNGCRVENGYVQAVGTPKSWLACFQILEYTRAFLSVRVAAAHMKSLLLISGAFGVFRRDALMEIGGLRHDTVGEDLEVIVRLHRHFCGSGRPYKIDFIPEIVVWTDVPQTIKGLRNQRARWQQGALETLAHHRSMIGNPRYRQIGLWALPIAYLEDVIGPFAELLGWILMPIGFALGIIPAGLAVAFIFQTIVIGLGLSIGALVLDNKTRQRKPPTAKFAKIMFAALIEGIGYRQLSLLFRLDGIRRYLRKEKAWAAAGRSALLRS